jgi:uncharacterized protein (UPF0332 family)
MSYIKDLVDCERERLLRKNLPLDPDIIKNEREASDYDLASARRDFEFDDYKWATIKAYYCMYHIASAIARSRGYDIENHQCMYLFLDKLVATRELESSYAKGFRSMITVRKQADYSLSFSKTIAEESLRMAADFNNRLKKLIK